MTSLNNGHDQDPDYILAAGGTIIVVATTMVGLRFYTRHVQKVGYGIDDWLALGALVMILGCGIDLIVGVRVKALGFPTPPPPDPDDPDDERSYIFTTVEKLEWSFFLMQILSMGLIKLSFIFFFRRIFLAGKPFSIFGIISAALAVGIALWCAAFFFWFLLSCGTDFKARWTTINTLHSVCYSDLQSDFALAISDFVTDVLILFLPIPMVLQLRMNTRRKIAVIGVFGLGFVALVASIVRLVFFINIIYLADGKIKDPSADNDLLVSRSLYWSMLESGLAIMACCLPTLNSLARLPALQSFIKSFRSMTSLRSYRTKSERLSEGNDLQDLRDRDNNSTASELAFVPKNVDKANIETQAVYVTPDKFQTVHKDDIWVAHTVDQRSTGSK